MPTVGGIKATFVGCGEIKDSFSKSSCIVLVSVGQKAHEGENFQATMALVNNYFSECTILVADSLQRHNLVFTDLTTLDDSHKKSLQLGEQWIDRNLNVLSSLAIHISLAGGMIG